MWRTIISATLLVGTAYAEDPFACVDPDVASAFLGNPFGGSGVYSTEIPEDFAELSMPDDFSLVGSQSLDIYSSVVFKSGLPVDQALANAVASMQDLGWTALDNSYDKAQGGFQSVGAPLQTVICNADDSNFLLLMSTERSGDSFVSVMRHQGNLDCNHEGLSGRQTLTDTLLAHMPTMALPDGVSSSHSGTMSGGDDAESSVDISGSLSRAELTGHFEDQIRDQGWESQTNWSSLHSSGSVWALTSDKHGLLIGTLHLVESESGLIRVRFKILAAESTHGGANSNWSLSSG